MTAGPLNGVRLVAAEPLGAGPFGSHGPAYRRAPALDADRREVLTAAGYDPAGIEALRRRGAFGNA